MDAPEELLDALAAELRPWLAYDCALTVAASVLAVPAITDALARDAKVAEIVGDFPYGATSSQMVALAEEVLDVHRWTAP